MSQRRRQRSGERFGGGGSGRFYRAARGGGGVTPALTSSRAHVARASFLLKKKQKRCGIYGADQEKQGNVRGRERANMWEDETEPLTLT